MANSPAIEGGTVVKLTVFSNDAEIPGTTGVISVVVRKALNRLPLAEIVVRDGDMPDQDFPISNEDYFKPGSTIKINAGYEQEETTIFEGVVIKHSIKITGDNDARLIAECRDKTVAMTIGRKNANYVDLKDSDIITSLIGNYSGLTADVSATETQHKELVQYYCSDWDFMLSRAEVNGLLVSVDDAKVTVKAPVTDLEPQLKVTYGQDLMEFHASTDARTQFSTVHGVAWDISSQAIVEEDATPQTLNAQGDLDSATLAGVIALESFRLQAPVSMESTAVQSWAKGQQLKSGLARIQGRMSFQGNANAKIGELIELAGVGARFSGNVFVSSVEHVLNDGNWITEVEFGMSPEWFSERRDVVAPPASGLLPGIEGLHVGVVKKLDADPEGQHKVQVSIPLLQAETDGVWARLASFYASQGFGAFFVPEIGDEVVLGYFNNDPSSPVILGSLYSSPRSPAYGLTAENYKKAVVTKSMLKLEFDDEKKVITLVTPAGNKIVISDDEKSILIQDQNNNKIQLGSDGILLNSASDISITAAQNITLSATSGKVAIEAKAGDVSAKGMNVQCTADMTFKASGNASAEVSASGQTTIKGSMVMIN